MKFIRTCTIFNLLDTDIDMCTVIIKVIFYEKELMDLGQL